MRRLLGRSDDDDVIPLRNLKRPLSARINEVDDDYDDDRGLSVSFSSHLPVLADVDL
jgi:hypothetical protein